MSPWEGLGAKENNVLIAGTEVPQVGSNKALPLAVDEKTITPLLTCKHDLSLDKTMGPVKELVALAPKEMPPMLYDMDNWPKQERCNRKKNMTNVLLMV